LLMPWTNRNEDAMHKRFNQVNSREKDLINMAKWNNESNNMIAQKVIAKIIVEGLSVAQLPSKRNKTAQKLYVPSNRTNIQATA